ncbi:UNVERIFIED_CONTAM: hypothetical protein H355_011855 [Colinus virginianus]|nr:hypothetical protein H355_011855 [Colinus virginianus]
MRTQREQSGRSQERRTKEGGVSGHPIRAGGEGKGAWLNRGRVPAGIRPETHSPGMFSWFPIFFPLKAQFETPYVVRLHNFHQLAPPQPCFTFRHPKHGGRG